MKKFTLCVVFGGKSSEYEVSLRSAHAVISHLNKEKYRVLALGISKKGEWYLFDGDAERVLSDTWQGEGCTPVSLDLTRGGLAILGKEAQIIDVDLFMPVLHGEYGEDGRIQSLFEIAGAKYAGSDAFCSHICMNKRLTKKYATDLGVPVAREVKKAELDCDFAYPVFVKPTMGGSSVGVSRVTKRKELALALEMAEKYGEAMVEEQIDGSEIEVGVLEIGGEIKVSYPGMIRYRGAFYDYEAKYRSGDNEYLIPAPIGKEVTEKIHQYARKLFLGLGCRDLGRFDFFVKKNGDVVFNEVNTLPGFTDVSMFPKLFMSMGYSFEEILDAIIENAKKRS